MANFLFTSPTELKSTTIIGGNTDQDKYIYIISDVQETVILPLLGQELYDVIYNGAEADSLTGDYLYLYTHFVQPITKFQTVSNYVLISNFNVDNGGTYSNQSENAVINSQEELSALSNRYAGYADTYIDRFNDWICRANISEYKLNQDGVDAHPNTTNRSGWYFGLPSNVKMGK